MTPSAFWKVLKEAFDVFDLLGVKLRAQNVPNRTKYVREQKLFQTRPNEFGSMTTRNGNMKPQYDTVS